MQAMEAFRPLLNFLQLRAEVGIPLDKLVIGCWALDLPMRGKIEAAAGKRTTVIFNVTTKNDARVLLR